MHKFAFILILVVAALVRLLYIDYAGGTIQLQPDSQGYYSEGNFFNVNRMPGYSMLSSLAILATTHAHPPYTSPEFFSGTWIIILTQTLLGLIGLIFLYDTLLSIGISPAARLAFTALTGLNIYQFIWERAFLTEAPYIFIFIVLMRLFVSLLKKPSAPVGMVFTALSIFGFWLRPAGLLVPVILLPFVWLKHRTKKVFLLTLALILIYASVPVLHIGMNKTLYNFHGLSINTDFAVFGRILHYNIPVDSASTVRPLYDQVVSYRARGGVTRIPWYFFVANNNEIYDHMDALQEFDRLVIRGHLGEFANTVIGDIPKAFSDTYVEEVLYRSPAQGLTRTLFDTLTRIIASLQQTTVIFLILFPFSVWLYYKKQTRIHTFLFAIGLVEVYQLFSSLIFGGAWEYARHMITTQTFLFFFCFWWVGKMGVWVKKHI